MNTLHPYGAAAHAARFLDGLLAWWWPAPSGGEARAHGPEEREAVHRWEDEGGNSK